MCVCDVRVCVYECASENCYRDNKMLYVNGSRVFKYDFESQNWFGVRWKIGLLSLSLSRFLCAMCKHYVRPVDVDSCMN